MSYDDDDGGVAFVGLRVVASGLCMGDTFAVFLTRTVLLR